jgi:DNA-directed RNA polymerase subunit RPC12/RpoP
MQMPMIEKLRCNPCEKEFAPSRLPSERDGTKLCPHCGSKLTVSKTVSGDNSGRVKSKGRNKHRNRNKSRGSGR